MLMCLYFTEPAEQWGIDQLKNFQTILFLIVKLLTNQRQLGNSVFPSCFLDLIYRLCAPPGHISLSKSAH